MLNKPFRPPLLKQISRPSTEEETKYLDEQPAKRRRVNSNLKDDGSDNRSHPGVVAVFREPLLRITNPRAAASATGSLSNAVEGYYTVLWYGTESYLSVVQC
jgi:uncharacterized protein (DUF2345 family)